MQEWKHPLIRWKTDVRGISFFSCFSILFFLNHSLVEDIIRTTGMGATFCVLSTINMYDI